MNKDILKNVDQKIYEAKDTLYEISESQFALNMHPSFAIEQDGPLMTEIEEGMDFVASFLHEPGFPEDFMRDMKGKIPKEEYDKLEELKNLERKIFIRSLPYVAEFHKKVKLSTTDKKIRQLADMLFMPVEEFLSKFPDWLENTMKPREGGLESLVKEEDIELKLLRIDDLTQAIFKRNNEIKSGKPMAHLN